MDYYYPTNEKDKTIYKYIRYNKLISLIFKIFWEHHTSRYLALRELNNGTYLTFFNGYFLEYAIGEVKEDVVNTDRLTVVVK